MSSQRDGLELLGSPEVVTDIRVNARFGIPVTQNPAAVERHRRGQLELVDSVVVQGDFPWFGPDEVEEDAAPDVDPVERMVDDLLPLHSKEALTPDAQIKDETKRIEVYGRSLRGIKAAGRVALEGAELSANPEVKRLRQEFDSAIGEMFKTAPGIGEYVTMERSERYTVKDGKVMADADDPMEDVIQRGIDCSREVSETSNPAMGVQVQRDIADLQLLLEEVEPMFDIDHPADYNTVFAVSAYPEDGVELYGKQFWKELGYNTEFECAMLQMYHKTSENQVVTRTLSIDRSNMDRLVAMIERHGGTVPADCTVADLITHPITRSMTYEQASQFMDDLVADYERDAGLPPKLATTERLIARHYALRDRAFNDLYLEVAKSSADGKKTIKLTDFIASIRPAVKHMDAVYQQKLQEITRSSTFDDNATRLMHGMVLYSVAETVRGTIAASLNKRFRGKKKPLTTETLFSGVNLRQDERGFMEQLIFNLAQGIKLGISYGGCGALFDFGQLMALQQAFGGGEQKLKNDDEDAGDGLGPIEFMCKKNHRCRRPFGALLKKCRKCKDNGESVGC